MAKLPKNPKEFADPQYWKKFFEGLEEPFEWYGSYAELSSALDRYMKYSDQILQIGCGNSALAEQMFDNGFRRLRSIDTDQRVIDRMRQKHSKKRPGLIFQCRSALDTGELAESVNAIIDKGTLDAIFPHDSGLKEKEVVEGMFHEVDRVLAPFGRYLIVTLGQRHILHALIQHLIVTKLKMLMPAPPPLEYSKTGTFDRAIFSTEKCASIDEFIEKIAACQEFSLFAHQVSKSHANGDSMKFCDPKNGRVRYQMFIADDVGVKTLLSWGVFIVPLGREGDWLFSTYRGREELRSQCHLHRLLIVRMFRDQQYGNIEDVQQQLQSIPISAFKPNTARDGGQFLSYGAVDVRQTLAEGSSPISGKWVVEQVCCDSKMFRRLTFLGSSSLIQSEVEVLYVRTTESVFEPNEVWVLDPEAPLSCEHHRSMISALALLVPDGARMLSLGTEDEKKAVPRGLVSAFQQPLRLAVLGLGGGIFARFLYDKFPLAQVFGVELDPCVADIARNYFDFPKENTRLEVVICDAMDYLQKMASTKDETEKLDVVFVDLAGGNVFSDDDLNKADGHKTKDRRDADPQICCPPPEFVTERALRLMRDSLHPKRGVLAFNLVTRDSDLARQIKSILLRVFSLAYEMSCDDDVNEVILCPLCPIHDADTDEVVDEEDSMTQSKSIPGKQKNSGVSGKRRKKKKNRRKSGNEASKNTTDVNANYEHDKTGTQKDTGEHPSQDSGSLLISTSTTSSSSLATSPEPAEQQQILSSSSRNESKYVNKEVKQNDAKIESNKEGHVPNMIWSSVEADMLVDLAENHAWVFDYVEDFSRFFSRTQILTTENNGRNCVFEKNNGHEDISNNISQKLKIEDPAF